MKVVDHKAVADRVIGAAHRQLVGSRYAGAEITSVFWYGAVDLDPTLLTVWVTLSGLAEPRLPAWYLSGTGDMTNQPDGVTPELLAALDVVAQSIRQDLAAADWPNAGDSTVLFDAADRVRRGGWQYFNS